MSKLFSATFWFRSSNELVVQKAVQTFDLPLVIEWFFNNVFFFALFGIMSYLAVLQKICVLRYIVTMCIEVWIFDI